MKLATSLLCLIALSASVFGTAQASPASTDSVGTVNGEPILKDHMFETMEYLPNVGTLSNDRFVTYPPGLLALYQIIGDMLIMQLATKDGVAPTDDQVQAELRLREGNDPNYVKHWTDEGRSMAELTNSIKLDVARFNIITQNVIVTDQEVQTQYKNNPDQYTIPKLYSLRVIVVNTAADEAPVDAALGKGTAFADVAKQYSIDISRANGGFYGKIAEKQLPADVFAAIQTVKIGKTTDWLPVLDSKGATTGKMMKYLYEDATPESLVPLDAQLSSQIRKDLMIEKGTKANNLSKQLEDLKKNAVVKLNNPLFQKAFDNLRQTQTAGG